MEKILLLTCPGVLVFQPNTVILYRSVKILTILYGSVIQVIQEREIANLIIDKT